MDVLDAKLLLQVANGTAKALEEDASLYDFDADGRHHHRGRPAGSWRPSGETPRELDVTACAYQVPANGSIQVRHRHPV